MTFAEPPHGFNPLCQATQRRFRCGRVGSAEHLLAAAAAVPCLGHRFLACRGLRICLRLSHLPSTTDCLSPSPLHEAARGMFDRIPLTDPHPGYNVLALVFVARQVPEDRHLRPKALSLQIFRNLGAAVAANFGVEGPSRRFGGLLRLRFSPMRCFIRPLAAGLGRIGPCGPIQTFHGYWGPPTSSCELGQRSRALRKPEDDSACGSGA